MRIGLCDSGLGGLTVLKELTLSHPNNDYIYIGDNLNLPYGDKTKEELKELGQNLINFLESKNVDLIIIACGTLSSTVLKELKPNTKLIDIITPTINYVNKNIRNNITVLATKATINTHIFKNKLNNKVTEVECPTFVPMIEENRINENEINEKITNKNDTIILGCTHYSLLEPYIKQEKINMGKVLTQSIKENKGNGKVEIYFTLINDKLKQNVKNIIDKEVNYARITRS